MIFPFQYSHDAASPDGGASPRRRRLRAGQWELFIFFVARCDLRLTVTGSRVNVDIFSRDELERAQIPIQASLQVQVVRWHGPVPE